MAYRNRKKNYPLYETVHMDNFRTMVEQVTSQVPDNVAFSYKEKPTDKEIKNVTFAAFRERVRAIATEGYAMGFEGKKIAVIGEASVDWFAVYTALGCIGAVSVPIDKELPAPDAASIMNTAACEVLFLSVNSKKKLGDYLAAAPVVKTVIYMGDGEEENVAAMIARGTVRIAAGDNIYLEYPINPETLASIVFTSGTTGKGKGVMLSEKNICSDMEQGIYNFHMSKRSMFVLPPHHTFGSTVNFIGHFSQGAQVYISSGIRYVTMELAAYRPTHLVLVPLFVETFYKRIIATAEKNGKLKTLQRTIRISDALRRVGIDLRRVLFRSVTAAFGGNLEMIVSGGAAIGQSVIDFFESVGVTILNGYGITECAPLIACNRNEYRKAGAVGMPIIGGVAKILNPDENGEGEIAYKGPNVMLGYFNNPEATAEVMDEEGYFRTGDYGKIEVDRDGSQWIYITGRLKNLIIFSNGKNVYPEEIETAIGGIPGVAEVVVYAGESRSDKTKEIIVAEIYPDAETLERHGVTDAKAYFDAEVRKINQNAAPYKQVGLVKLRECEFEKNTSKKIVRFKIDKTID